MLTMHWGEVWTNVVADPVVYPLPQSLCRHGDLSISDDPDWEDHLIDNHGRETPLGVAIRQAWELISPDGREQVLFCWAARQGYREDRIEFAHPMPILDTAFDTIDCDPTGNLQYLQALALTLISQSPETFAT